MTEYIFKRAKVRRPETWTLSEGILSREGESISLKDVSEIMFTQAIAGRQWVTVLKLTTDEKTHTLQCNDQHAGQNRRQFISLASDTVSAMKRLNPDVSIRQGKGALIGSVMLFLAGLTFLLGGLFFIYGSYQNGHGALNFILGGLAVAIGIWFIKLGEPWKPLPKQGLEGLQQFIMNTRMAMDER